MAGIVNRNISLAFEDVITGLTSQVLTIKSPWPPGAESQCSAGNIQRRHFRPLRFAVQWRDPLFKVLGIHRHYPHPGVGQILSRRHPRGTASAPGLA